MTKYLIIFVLGAVLGTGYDYIHVYYGVLSYNFPDFAGTSLKIVPFEFGFGGVIGAVAVQRLARKFAPPRVTAARLALDSVLLLVGYFATGFFNGQNGVTAACLVALAAVAVLTRPTAFVLVGSAVAAVVGPLSEALISSAGVFQYTFSHPIPYWLPALWVIAAGLFLDLPVVLFLQPGVSPEGEKHGALNARRTATG